MFSRGMDVVLEYSVVLEITDDSLSKRTMRLVNAKFPVKCESAKWAMVFKIRYLHIERFLTICG